MTVTPLTRRRLDNFKANRRGYWSFWIFLLIFVDTISCLIPPKCITNNNNHHFSTSFNLHISKLSQKNSSVHFTNAMSLTMHSQNSQECTGIVCNYELYTCFSAEMTLGAHRRINRKTLQIFGFEYTLNIFKIFKYVGIEKTS